MSNKAAACLMLGRFADAQDAAQASLAADAGNDKARFRLAKALAGQGSLDQAKAALTHLDAIKVSTPEIAALHKTLTARFPAPATNAPQRAVPQGPAWQWSVGLDQQIVYEWLVDCYRMRIDDDYAWGGGTLRGLYEPNHSAADILTDFLAFAKLAVKNSVIPSGWNWEKFISAAKRLIMGAFEKSDAQNKYGEENVFAVVTGGRSLRFTAELVYGFAATHSGDAQPAYEAMEQAAVNAWKLTQKEFFADVGGFELWKALKPALKR